MSYKKAAIITFDGHHFFDNRSLLKT